MANRMVKIKLLGKEHTVNCPEGQADKLHMVVEELEKRINNTQKSKTMLQTNENILIMTALNMAHDLLDLQAQLDLNQIDNKKNIS